LLSLDHNRPAVVIFALLTLLVTLAAAQFGGMPGMMGGGQDERPPAVRSDVQYVRCGVCAEFVKEARAAVKEMRAKLEPGKKVCFVLLCGAVVSFVGLMMRDGRPLKSAALSPTHTRTTHYAQTNKQKQSCRRRRSSTRWRRCATPTSRRGCG
jgi:hypothetical protein